MTNLSCSYPSREQLLEKLVDSKEGESKTLIFMDQACLEKKINATLPSKDKSKIPKRPKPFILRALPKELKSVAKRQIRIAQGRERKRMKYWERLENEHCNNDGCIYKKRYFDSMGNVAEYWKTIKFNNYFQKVYEDSMKISCSEDLSYTKCQTLHLLNRAIHCILPNNITIGNFQPIQYVFGWEYQRNLRKDHQILPHRWCGNRGDFFEPLVIRFKRDESGRKINVEGLCPYCSLTYRDKYDGYNDFFLPLKTLAYEAHLAYHHGVYNTGEEMPPPLFFREKKNNMLVCHDCKRARHVHVNKHARGDEYLLEYFAHCCYQHPRRNLSKSRKTQYLIKGQQVERII